jgi:hypothetical protein
VAIYTKQYSHQYCYGNKIKDREMGRAGGMHGSDEKHRTYAGKPEGNRHRRRWDGNIKTYLKEIGFRGYKFDTYDSG